jgi:hypothetical protein
MHVLHGAVFTMNDEEITHHLTTLAECFIQTHHRSLARTNKSMNDILHHLDSCDVDAKDARTVYNMNDEEITHHLTTLADSILRTHHRSSARTNKSMNDILHQLDSCHIDADAIQHSRLMMSPSMHPPTLNETTVTKASTPVQNVMGTKDAQNV